MAALTRALSVWSSLVLAGCCIQPTPMPTPRPNEVTSVPIPSGAPIWDGGLLFIGTAGEFGGDAFAPLDGGVRLATGPQGGGGRHVFLTYRLTGAPLVDELIVTARITKSDGRLLGSAVQPVRFGRSDAGQDAEWSQRVVLCPTPVGVSLVGDTLTVEAWAQTRENGPVGAAGADTFRPLCEGSCAADCGG
ncbi:MAG: hypothetical protein JNJ54_37370 [Myxococcaceae bacterium]|nr:hypothetical protein [Myxococcaceae bacterium]